MAGRHSLLAVVLFAVTLHAIAITQTILPAQDGIKFIRIARSFQTQPWTDVVRGSDAHPLYPALIAMTEPAVAWFAGDGPDTWRMAAQIVAVFGAIGLLIPIYAITQAMFDRRIALLAAGLAVLLPRTAELGHDTLSDSFGLMSTCLALWLGAIALRRGEWKFALGAGLAAGFGYLARFELILVPFAIGLTWLIGVFRDSRARTVANGPALAVLLLSTIAVIGCYAMVKGEISEKLPLRIGAGLGPRQPAAARLAPPKAARGLDNPHCDFSPKEETDRIPIRNWQYAVLRIMGKWWEELCWLFAVMTVWGIVRQTHIRSLCPDHVPGDGEVQRRLLAVFAVLYGLNLVRVSALLGYMSGRHIMPLVCVSLPWAAAGSFVCARGIAVKRRWTPRFARNAGIVAACLLVVASIAVQSRPNHLNHLSRWGHWCAGQWLADHADSSEMVLDTRGWARFISGQPGYDYWHVRQALTDSRLTYIVVGLDELEARSSRARTLRALLAYSATPVKDFPAYPGDRTTGVRLYRFHRPGTWEGLAP